MKKARFEDKNIVVDILAKSLKYDPHINYLLEKSKNKDKLRIIMEHVFDESFNKGEIYLNEDNTAVALWDTAKKEHFNWKFIYRRLSFLVQIGIDSALRILKMDKLVHLTHSQSGQFAHLSTIAVLPESRGKGYVKQLINFMVEKMSRTKSTLYLETENTGNIGIYNKVGFHVFKTIQMDGHTVFCMKRQ